MTDAVLVTGGAGYVGSHTVVELLATGHEVVVADDFSNSSPVVLDRITQIAGRPPALVEGDLRDLGLVEKVFSDHPIVAVMHFAGLKSVGHSVAQPTRYYRDNLGITLNLLDVAEAHAVDRFVFSSSATVYGAAHELPTPETAPIQPTNPYGSSKAMIEQILRDAAVARPMLAVALLRYFNPVGAHPSGRIGEDPRGEPTNLMPFLMQVATGKRPELRVFGADYPTPDGTGIRDYVHVVDLAQGHLAALTALERLGPGVRPWNLGTGQGASVFEMLAAASAAVGRELPHVVIERRPGDVAESRADPTRAAADLGWRAPHDLARMCVDSWRWQSANPHGYD